MRTRYWYKALGNTNGICKTLEGSLNADSPEQALAMIESYKNTWELTRVASVSIYDMDSTGEISEDPIVSREFPRNPMKPLQVTSYHVTKKSVADKYEEADWTRPFKEPTKFPTVTLKEIQQ